MARRKDVFLVNVWRDGESLGYAHAGAWRGSVEHVHTRRRLYFTDLVDLVTFLTAYTSAAPVDEHPNA